MLGFDALGEAALGEEPSGSTRVPVRNGEQAHFAFSGTAYTQKTDFNWGASAPVSSVTGTGATTLGFTVAAAGQHSAPVATTASGATTLAITAAVDAGHGVKGAGAASVSFQDAAAGAHGISGAEAASLSFSVAAAGAHGITGAGAATLTCTPAVSAVHQRYEVHGTVKQGGILVNRRVRVYLRSTGALLNEADTVAGAFAIHTGFAPVETYIVPIHMDDAATDWLPPVANRVASVLAQDA